jgi:hypothetical protein
MQPRCSEIQAVASDFPVTKVRLVSDRLCGEAAPGLRSKARSILLKNLGSLPCN